MNPVQTAWAALSVSLLLVHADARVTSALSVIRFRHLAGVG